MEFKLPDIGEGLTEGEIVKWLVKVGDVVKADQNIVQVETDKAVADLPAPVGGKITKINHNEGDIVKVGEVLCVIGSEGDKVGSSVEKEKEKVKTGGASVVVPKKVSAKVEKSLESKEMDVEEVEQKHSEHMIGEAQTGKVLAAPAVRSKASEMKIDLSKVKGSGEGGRVLLKDLGSESKQVKGEIDKPEVPQGKVLVKKKYDEFGYLERVPLKGIRKTIAENMMKSLRNTAQVTSMEDIDVTKLWDLRKREKKAFEKKKIKLTFLPYVIKALIAAAKENPIINSTLEGEEILIKKYFNVGVAVETEVGLMVPVIKIAEKKSIESLAKEILDLAEKARSRKIDVMDMKGGTITITNYGSLGGTYGTPVLNPPESAILGLGRIFDRAVVDAKGNVRNAKVLPVSLTFDHRVMDGAQASRFLNSLKMFLEDPGHLLSAS